MSFFDANVGIGHWPFRKLLVERPAAVRAELVRAGIGEALVYSLDAVFCKDVQSGNRELAPLVDAPWAHVSAVVDPTRAGALDDLHECEHDLSACAVRFVPGYHGYALGDPAVREFLAATDLPVFITVRLEDERLHHPVCRVAPPDLGRVTDLATCFPDRAFVLVGIMLGEAQAVQATLPADARVYYEISRMTDQDFLPTVLDALPADRLLFGSGRSLFTPECAVAKVLAGGAAEETVTRIGGENLEGLLGRS